MADSNQQKFLLFFYSDYESLGIEYISSVLKANNIRTSLIYKNIQDFYASDAAKRINYNQVAKEICELNPDVLGLSLLTDTFQVNMTVAAEVKKLNPEIKVLAGGVHAGLLPELTLGFPQIDAVCIGEGEFSTLDYMQNFAAISNGVTPVLNGVVYKQNGCCIGDLTNYTTNEDLDSFPFPDKDLFYRQDPSMQSHYFVQCSRGCPYRCSFCVNDRLNEVVSGKRFRSRSPENIIDELILAKEKYSPSFVVFVDELFGAKKDWSEKFLASYKEKIGLPFLASLHPNIVTESLVDLMASANCWYVAMGVQSLNEKISREVLRRSINKEKLSTAIKLIRSRKITLQCDHILGIQGETEKDMVDALHFYNENRPSLVSVYWLSYYPKAYITQHARDVGILSEREIEDIEHGRISSGIKKVKSLHEINFWFNYFTFFPKWFIRFLLRSGLYRLFKIKSFYISSALPRALHALLNKRDWNRYYLKRVVMKKLNNYVFWSSMNK
ncbi:MAG: radical SAM protein [Candidatus Scalindua sp. AMX11]|nr:MAG: radical SAM protein [Candidatus Scalindua sp.]NOG84109.1 B12-binding domain-containing radical SAM protein [Planctomycetota bacterium]RZV98981.1 MAG: B12-binding domain-containing radical SAM protein [Candidatus Scalindua sp. SCAELEC01]TDE66827.1 MAG: radical SAM protein [Candidatus Scalindua sp. AMX11]GJQ57626.1 MAG: hypothetical protein SCALA701_04270 [Candidatus Scalindua sp.]